MKTRKTLNIVSIVISAVLIAVLLAALIVGIHFSKKGSGNLLNFGFFGSNGFVGDSGYTTDAYTGEMSDISDIDIGWASGAVNVSVTEGSELALCEEGDASEYKMCWKLEDGKLSIRYSAKSFSFIGFESSIPKKTLTLTLPASVRLRSLTVDTAACQTSISDVCASEIRLDGTSGAKAVKSCTAENMLIDSSSGETRVDDCRISGRLTLDITSGTLEVHGVSAGTFDVDSSSGKKIFDACECQKLSVDSTSGSLSYSGKATAAEIDSSSGAIFLSLDETTESIEIDVTSGSTKISLPENAGFDVNASLTSGKLKCEFADARFGKDYASRDGVGSVKVRIDGSSGSVTVSPR